LIRFDGAGFPPFPRALAGIIVGNAAAVADVVINLRRDKTIFLDIDD
jgi:hypothetical protein